MMSTKQNLMMSLLFVLIGTIGLSQKITEITGKMKKGKGTMVYLQHSVKNQLVTVDSAQVNFFGKYKLKTEVEKHDFYKISTDKAGKNYHLLLLKGEEKIRIKSSTDFTNKSYSLQGSADSKLIQEYYQMKSTDSITKDSMSNYAFNFVKKNAKSLVVFIALNDISNPKEAIKIAEVGIGETYPKSIYHNSLKNAITQIERNERARKAQKAPKTPIGSVAPELNMVSPEGKIITLASLRGKYVLIDFWASWCGPCRRENPSVVRLYNKYKDQGFEVYSVSLDKNKNRWLSAIKQDKLSWSSHVSDLRGWSSAACQIYGFRGIPYTVLIDKEGKIIATRLRGGALENKLKQIFGN